MARLIIASLLAWGGPWHARNAPVHAGPASQPARDVSDAHPCCPRTSSNAAAFVMQAPAPTDMPCSEQHDCCFRNVPLAPPSLPVPPPTPAPKVWLLSFTLPSPSLPLGKRCSCRSRKPRFTPVREHPCLFGSKRTRLLLTLQLAHEAQLRSKRALTANFILGDCK